MPKDNENEKSRSTVRIDRNDDPRRKHPQNILVYLIKNFKGKNILLR